MFPQVVNETLVNLFKYWHSGIQEGMLFRDQLYAYVRSYPCEQRLEAYELGCELAQQGLKTCITRSDQRYAIWISLQSPLEEVERPLLAVAEVESTPVKVC